MLRVGLEVRGDDGHRSCAPASTTAPRTSLTIALDDRGQFVPAAEPEPNPGLLTAFDDSPPPVACAATCRPSMTASTAPPIPTACRKDMTKQLIKLLASDVDFQSRLNPTDRIEVFFSQPDGDDQMSDEFRAALRLGDLRRQRRATSTASRWRTARVDYFDEDGRSAKQFLLRNPVPNGQFRSGFGAAPPSDPRLCPACTPASTGPRPRGTPIIAAGNGVVEKAGWAGGYGKQTIIRHANGYETSYNHQSALRQGHRARRARPPGPGHRLCRHDRPLDRRPSALRADRQRHQGRPDARPPAGRPGAEGRGARQPSSASASASTICSRRKTTAR